MLTLLTGAGSLLVLYGLALTALFLFQRRILFHPDTTRPDLARVLVPGLQPLTVTTEDGLPLLAWYLPPGQEGGRVVLYLHGNAGHIGHRAYRLGPFRKLGWGVLLLQYRGYGGNPGAPSEAGLLLDAEAGLAAVQGRGVAPERTLLWGESLGTNLAVRLAEGRDVGAVLLESPFTSVAELARRQYPFVPVDFLLKDRFDTLSHITAVRSPVFFMQGGRDRLVPAAIGKKLFEVLTAPKELWVAPEADHNDLGACGAVEAAIDFVRAHPSPRPSPSRGEGEES